MRTRMMTEKGLSRFALKGSVLLLVFLPGYLYCLPVIETSVLHAAKVILSLSDVTLSEAPTSGWVVSRGSCSGHCGVAFGNERFSQGAFLGLAVVSSLILATALPLKERMRAWCAAGVLFVALEALSMAGCSYAIGVLCLEDTRSRLCRNLAGLLSPLSVPLSVFVWYATAGRCWFPGWMPK